MENLHTPPRRSSRRAAFVANARLTAILTPMRGRPAAAARLQEDEAAVEEIASNGVFRDEDSLSSVESSETDEVECCICLEDFADDVARLDGCEHQFCLDCITQWAETNNVCPLCRFRFTTIESAGGVLQRVPDRRPAVAPLINLVRIFNLEEIDGGEGEDNDPNPFALTLMLRRMLEQQEVQREVQRQQLQEVNRQLEQNRRQLEQMRIQAEQNTVQLRLDAERAAAGAAERPAEVAELNVEMNRILDNLRSLL